MLKSHHRVLMTTALVVALVLVAGAAAACSAQATAGLGDAAATTGAATTSAGAAGASGTTSGAKTASNGDWSRVAAALAWMKADPPTKPVVVLLGGSAARESTISDSSWRKQIVSKGGPDTLAWNMGSRNRTMAQNLAIVRSLPKGIHAIVYIGINLGSFTSAQKTATIKLPSPAPSTVSTTQPHQYTRKHILSTAKKRTLVKKWLSDRYPVFKRNFATSATVLARVISTCRSRGYKPVLFELPRNTAVIGSSLNAPTKKYRAKCKTLAAKYHVPWVSLVSSARLPNSSFYDLWHLVEPGRKVWQKLLSAKTAALLKKYGYDGGA
jgi:hypothetical protein